MPGYSQINLKAVNEEFFRPGWHVGGSGKRVGPSWDLGRREGGWFSSPRANHPKASPGTFHSLSTAHRPPTAHQLWYL